MSILSRILQELKMPDDQGNDWYGWASNQLSHAFFGVVVACYSPEAAVQTALVIGLLKECADLMRVGVSHTAVIDSVFDAAFWALGAWLLVAQDKNMVVVCICMALLCGVIPRGRNGGPDLKRFLL